MGALRPSHAVDILEVDVDVDVDLGVDTTGHPLATDNSHCGLGSACGTSGSSCLPSIGRAQVHLHDHAARCLPDTLTGSEELGARAMLLQGAL